MLNALHVGDVMNDLIYQVRPFEVNKGETEKVFQGAMDKLSTTLRDRPPFEIMQRAPKWSKDYLSKKKTVRILSTRWARFASTSTAISILTR